MSKPFFYRITAADFLAAVVTVPEADRAAWVLSLALDMVSGESDTAKSQFAKDIITEAGEYKERRANAGRKGGVAKASNAKQCLAKPSLPLASSSTEAVTETITEEPKEQPLSSAKAADCPHVEIIEAYHELLPSLPNIRVWNDSSKSNLRARWREDKERQTVIWWRDYFQAVYESDFLMGRVTDWNASLSWLVGPKNFEKVMNGQYENKSKQDFGGDW